MRGKVMHVAHGLIDARITPAHAGKSLVCFREIFGIRDHPRACGEKLLCGFCVSCRLGSPPRMRGKEQDHTAPYPDRRITPAHAGKSRQRGLQVSRNGDHPRACGEKFILSCVIFL